ncbi:MAG: molybdopterin synthase sulfur carrier subunit [Rhodothermales bacterium]|nr:molybdopterin synthase sulfur carrier subunit [Rhodothermales bacterium]
MNVSVIVPSALRRYSDGRSRIMVSAANVRASLEAVRADYPALYRSVCDETGAVRRHVNVFVNNDNVKRLGGLDTGLSDGDEVSIIHAVSGG